MSFNRKAIVAGPRRVALLGTFAALVLSGCARGSGPQAASVNLDDAQAAFLSDHRLESLPASPVEIEVRPNLTPEEQRLVQERVGVSAEVLKNVVVDADFTGERKTLSVQADVELDAQTVQRVTFSGEFRPDGKAYLRNVAFPYLLLVAQCLRDCQSVLLNVLLSERQNGKTVLITEQMVASSSEEPPTQVVLPDFTPTPAKVKLPDFTKDVVAVGNYPPPVVDPQEIQTLVPRPPANAPAAPVLPTLPTLPGPSTPQAPPTTPVAFEQIQGPGVVIGEFQPGDSSEGATSSLDFPLPLAAQYTGRAEGCYAVFVDATNGGFCRLGGALAFANLIPKSGLGFTRYSKDTHAFGSGLALRFVEVLTRKSQAQGVELKVGNLSAERGGLLRFSDGTGAHTAHQNGLEVDLSLPYRTPVSSRSHFRTLSSSVDYEALWKVIKTMGSMEYTMNGQKRPIVNRIYLDRRHIRQLCPLAKSDIGGTSALKLLQHIDGHTTHLHIRLEVTPHNPSAKEVIVRPADQVCPT